jgi:hypothetical protein
MAEPKHINDITTSTAQAFNPEKQSSTERIEFIADDGKKGNISTVEYAGSSDEEKLVPTKKEVRSARDLVTEVLAVEDDPSVNPWTFRMWFIGLSMSVFAG